MKIHLDTPTEEARIEIIPLIDVIFCILIFFILAALQLTRQQAISVELPQAKTGTLQIREMLIVSLDAAGQIYVDQQPVNSEQLLLILRGYQQSKPEGLMVLYADRSAVYANVITLLDQMRAIGGTRVALATLPDAAAPRRPATLPLPPFKPTLPGVGNSPVLPTFPTTNNSAPLGPTMPGIPAAQPSPLPTLPLPTAPLPEDAPVLP
ncbi:biopolymer transporter ExbD [Trichothermofontia sp.]